MSCIDIKQILEDAKWEAEFAEGREADLIAEYRAAKADGGEQGHDGCFPTLSGPGFTLWIQRQSAPDLLCYFDDAVKARDFGHAYLIHHTTEYVSGYGSLGLIGYSNDIRIELHAKRGAPKACLSAFVVPVTVALKLGLHGMEPLHLFDKTKDSRVKVYMLG